MTQPKVMKPVLKPSGVRTMRLVFILLALGALQACTSPAVIADINDSSVHVQSGLGTTPTMIQREAEKGCAIYGKIPVELSYRCMDQNCIRRDTLFACKADALSTATPPASQAASNQQAESAKAPAPSQNPYGFRVLKRDVGRSMDTQR